MEEEAEDDVSVPPDLPKLVCQGARHGQGNRTATNRSSSRVAATVCQQGGNIIAATNNNSSLTNAATQRISPLVSVLCG